MKETAFSFGIDPETGKILVHAMDPSTKFIRETYYLDADSAERLASMVTAQLEILRSLFKDGKE